MADAVLSVGGSVALTASLHVPYAGLWYADFDFASPLDLSGRVDAQIGSLALSGTVDPDFSGSFQARYRVRIVGGAGWRSGLPAKHTHNDAGVRIDQVVGETATACGETLAEAPTTRLGVDFVRPAGPASRIFRMVDIWWVDYAGTTHVATRPATEIAVAYEVLEYDPRQKIATLSTDVPESIGIGSIVRTRLDKPLTVLDLQVDASKGKIRIRVWGSE